MHLPPRFLSLVSLLCVCVAASGQTRFSAGAAKIDISPRQLPANPNGGFLQATWDRVEDPLHGRCLVLDDGDERLAVVIVDSCMIPTNVCYAIKNNVATRTSLRADRILIS